MKTFLSFSFKQKELQTSLQWLDEQIAHSICFSTAASNALRGYREFVALRLSALENHSLIQLGKTLRCGRYIHLKGLLADAATIIFRL